MKKKYILKSKRKFITTIFFTLLTVFTIIIASNVYGFKEPCSKAIVVENGDTLWSIAKENSNNTDIRRFIYEIKKINKLSSSDINKGTILKIPNDK